MSYVVAVIAPGAMGSAIGRRLHENGVTVRTSLQGRSDAACVRARASGMEDADDALIAGSDFILSVVPPSEAMAFATRLSPALKCAPRKPVFIDCNAVSPKSVCAVSDVVAETGTPFVDASIIGFPPEPDADGPAIYVSGPHAQEAMVLSAMGLDLRYLDAPIGAASALKMSYAGITKGLTGLAAAMILAATRSGAGPALRAELEKSQPLLLKRFMTSLPDMYPKAYRWVAEMQEISLFASDDNATHAIYSGLASLFERLASDHAGQHVEVAAIEAFLAPLTSTPQRDPT